jgi:type I restriction enzyme R subunit
VCPRFKERLEPLQDKRIRVSFLTNAIARSLAITIKAIKEFFPNAQLFGFTGTPIFEDNATYKQVDGTIGSYKTTDRHLSKTIACLHHYTRD